MLNKLSLELFHDRELIPLLIVELIVISAGMFILKRTGKTEYKKEGQWTLRDTVVVCLICLCFLIAGSWKLGTVHFPATFWSPQQAGDSFILEIQDPSAASDEILILSGEAADPDQESGYRTGLEDLVVEGSAEGTQWVQIADLEKGAFQQYTVLKGKYNYRYLRFTSFHEDNVILEIGVKRAGFDEFLPLTVVNASPEDRAWNVIDEQDCLVSDPLYLHQTYFDEIYHVRNAKEIAEGYPMYAFVHPLLGTQMIALMMKILGNNPFAWRIAGVLISTAMIALMYAMAHTLFHRRFASAVAAIFLAVDFMHMTTARIGTLEPFSVFFIMLMTWFMMLYCQSDPYRDGLKKGLILLMLSGISMGIGVSVKWTGAYAGIGLAVLFFACWYFRYQQYRKAKHSEERNEREQKIVDCFPQYMTRTFLWCCLFFVLVPLLIYAFSYLPCMIRPHQPWSIQAVIDQTVGMFDYHAHLSATHPFQSVWWQWILDLRPIWYYFHETPEAVYTISAMGHPLIWWAGFAGVVYCFIDALKHRSVVPAMIVTAYFAQLAPWLLVSRCVFIYHYYPSVPFLILALVYGLNRLTGKDPAYEKRVRIFVLVCILLFILFLPAIAGFGTTHEYIDGFLRWFPGWYFG